MIEVEKFNDERIIVRYPFKMHKQVREAIGGRFVGPDKGGPGLSFVLDLDTCKRIREKLPDSLFSEELLDWGRQISVERDDMARLARAGDGELLIVAERMPKMYAKLRDYQRAGIRFIADAGNPLIADQPGLGKTWEAIGGVYESGLGDGPNLVVCPKIAIESVWLGRATRVPGAPRVRGTGGSAPAGPPAGRSGDLPGDGATLLAGGQPSDDHVPQDQERRLSRRVRRDQR
jgi:hypothetical protein